VFIKVCQGNKTIQI